MKNLSKLSATLIALVCMFGSCKENKDPLSGKWKMDGVGTIDTANAKGNLIGYAMLTMMSNGAEFMFNEPKEGVGTFTISTQGKEYVTGDYTLSGDRKKLTMKAQNTEESYGLVENEKELVLTSEKDGSVLNLKKE